MSNTKKIILIIIDGFGLSKKKFGNAIALAKKPTLVMLFKTFPNTTLKASGKLVGLPSEQMGNSEVGHLNIGAGRIIYTGLSLINNEIKTNKFQKNKSFVDAITHVKKNHSKLHIIGLCSEGGVHSSLQHIFELMKISKKENINSVLHIISDGRDVKQKQMREDIKEIERVSNETNTKIGSISGRFYAMDRDCRWERVETAYNTILGKNNSCFNDATKYIEEMYKQNITDEFFKPALNNSYKKDEVTIKDNDALIFANFRPDRARELSHLIYGSSCFHYESKCKKCKNLFFVTMTNYEGIKPTSVAFPPITYNNVLGEVISKNKLHQLRIAETEKYAHVTFFFDGGKEINFPFEKKIIIASPKVATYDLLPEMSATKICDEIINNYKKYDLIICNFANCDMVGHTGNMNATIKAVESVDKQITKLYQLAIKNNITLFITADHGNADKMLDEKGVVTTHTTADVPFIIADKNVSLLKSNDNKLADIAPTILNYLNLKVPKEMDGKNLLIKKLNINK